jgi:hypothetical protein
MWKLEKCNTKRLAGKYVLPMHTLMIFYQLMTVKVKTMFDDTIYYNEWDGPKVDLDIITIEKNDDTLNGQNARPLPYVISGIDKITLGIENKCLNYRKSPDCLEHIIDIVSWGNWSELNIQLETNGNSNIDNYYPWHSVLTALQYGISAGLFIEPIANYLRNCISAFTYMPLFYFIPNFIRHCFYSGLFKLDEYEIFFDFYNYDPFIRFDDTKLKRIGNSVYTRDYKKIRRLDGEIKGSRRSLFCYYDRGKKIGSQLNVTRCEIRICDERAKKILSPEDILLPLNNFIDKHCFQIRGTLNRYIRKGSIVIDDEYIMQYAPDLLRLVDFK